MAGAAGAPEARFHEELYPKAFPPFAFDIMAHIYHFCNSSGLQCPLRSAAAGPAVRSPKE